MNNYVAIFRVPTATMDQWLKDTPKEEMEAQMVKMEADMTAWVEKHKANFVGKGIPLGKTMVVTKDGAAAGRNDLNYMQMVQAPDHEAACALFADCPHVTIPDSTVDVMAVPHLGV
jgi:hypothetical protein